MKKQIKVAYFPSDTSKDMVLGRNGKSLDKYCIKCESEEDLSTGNYICDLTFLIDDNIQDLLQEEVILKLLMDYGYEIFRISKVTVGTRYIYVVARQITIADSLTLWLEDVRPTNLNGQSAVTWLLDNAEGKKEIQIISDIDTIATAYYQRMSLYKALHDSDNSFLNRWGGEIQRRGYTVYINKRIGIDRGFTIREGKNLTGFESTSNIDSLVTRAIGQGYNGILGNYIDSPLIVSYNQIYTSVIKYDDVKVKDEYNDEGYDTLEQAQAELDRRIEEEFSENDIDKIKASYTINFVQLEKTEEYKKYIVAEKLFIGDDCRVYIPKLNVDIKVRALSKKYDVLAQKTKEINLSNYIETKPLTLKQIADKLDAIDSTATILQLAKDNATSLIKGGLKNSYVIVRENEIIIGD
uniref:phage tail spike protein n=1 Tax=uncultured Clostridium sp. TaxID=59620 RepID=UPI00259AB50F